MSKKETVKMVLFALALAMGVASVVLDQFISSNADIDTFLGIAILCLAIAGFMTVKSESF